MQEGFFCLIVGGNDFCGFLSCFRIVNRRFNHVIIITNWESSSNYHVCCSTSSSNSTSSALLEKSFALINSDSEIFKIRQNSTIRSREGITFPLSKSSRSSGVMFNILAKSSIESSASSRHLRRFRAIGSWKLIWWNWLPPYSWLGLTSRALTIFFNSARI